LQVNFLFLRLQRTTFSLFFCLHVSSITPEVANKFSLSFGQVDLRSRKSDSVLKVSCMQFQ